MSGLRELVEAVEALSDVCEGCLVTWRSEVERRAVADAWERVDRAVEAMRADLGK